MKKLTKLSFVGVGLFVTVAALSSCTASFCSQEDTAKILYTFERGVTKYYDQMPTDSAIAGQVKEVDGSQYGLSIDKIYTYSNIDNSKLLRTTIVPALTSAEANYYVPAIEFFEAVDAWVLNERIPSEAKAKITSVGEISIKKTNEEGKDYYETNYDETTLYGVLNRYGYYKFYSDPRIEIEGEEEKVVEIPLFDAFEKKVEEWRNDPVMRVYTPGNDYLNYYKNALTQATVNYRSCIYTVGETGDLFGMYGDPELNNFYEQIEITKKDWGYAWTKGFFEGLLIYPISAFVDLLTTSFAGSNAGLISGNGWAQVGAILLVTIILRALIMVASLKATLGQAKMQKLQPQLAKLQEKYPNSNTNQYEKQRLAQEQMALYKKNKVSPFGQIIVMIAQFPVFICVWGALSGSSALSTGTFYNMNLSETVWNTLNNTTGWPGNENGWWTAFVLILLMTIFQVAATIIPLIIQKIQRKNVVKTGTNPAANKQNKTMKIVQFVMLAMIVVMGFTLPSAMGVYWIAGAIFSIAQSLITFAINNKKGKGNKKEKPAKAAETIDGKEVIEAVAVEEIPAEPTENNKKPSKNNKKQNNYKEFKYPKKRGGRR